MLTAGRIGTFVFLAFMTWLLIQVFQKILGAGTLINEFVRNTFSGVFGLASSAKEAADELFENVGAAIESEGFATSEGQNDPRLLYAIARSQEADKQGLVGVDEQRSPAGFPSFEDWSAAVVGG